VFRNDPEATQLLSDAERLPLWASYGEERGDRGEEVVGLAPGPLVFEPAIRDRESVYAKATRRDRLTRPPTGERILPLERIGRAYVVEDCRLVFRDVLV
jgi:hypothetical protein